MIYNHSSAYIYQTRSSAPASFRCPEPQHRTGLSKPHEWAMTPSPPVGSSEGPTWSPCLPSSASRRASVESDSAVSDFRLDSRTSVSSTILVQDSSASTSSSLALSLTSPYTPPAEGDHHEFEQEQLFSPEPARHTEKLIKNEIQSLQSKIKSSTEILALVGQTMTVPRVSVLMGDDERDEGISGGREGVGRGRYGFLVSFYCRDPWEFQSRVMRQVEMMEHDLQELRQELQSQQGVRQ